MNSMKNQNQVARIVAQWFMLQLHAYNMHHKNVQTLPKQLEKEKNNLLNPIMQEVFEKYGYLDYNLRCQKNFLLPGVNKPYFGLYSLKYFCPNIWNIIPDEVKKLLTFR